MIEGAFTYLHCRQCVLRGQTERLEWGITKDGLVCNCKKHGIVGVFTPDRLRELMGTPPPCDCCAGGVHLS